MHHSVPLTANQTAPQPSSPWICYPGTTRKTSKTLPSQTAIYPILIVPQTLSPHQTAQPPPTTRHPAFVPRLHHPVPPGLHFVAQVPRALHAELHRADLGSFTVDVGSGMEGGIRNCDGTLFKVSGDWTFGHFFAPRSHEVHLQPKKRSI